MNRIDPAPVPLVHPWTHLRTTSDPSASSAAKRESFKLNPWRRRLILPSRHNRRISTQARRMTKLGFDWDILREAPNS